MPSTVADAIDKDTEESGIFVLVQGRAGEQAESQAANKAIVYTGIAEQVEGDAPVHVHATRTAGQAPRPGSKIPIRYLWYANEKFIISHVLFHYKKKKIIN